MIINKSRTYRTATGKLVMILCTDGPDMNYPAVAFVDGEYRLYSIDGRTAVHLGVGLVDQSQKLVEGDPHGILPRHRELLAVEFEAVGQPIWARIARDDDLDSMLCIKAALIALARLDGEKGE